MVAAIQHVCQLAVERQAIGAEVADAQNGRGYVVGHVDVGDGHALVDALEHDVEDATLDVCHERHALGQQLRVVGQVHRERLESCPFDP